MLSHYKFLNSLFGAFPFYFLPGVFRENMEIFYPGEYDSMYDTNIALTPSISIDPYSYSQLPLLRTM